MTLKESQAEAGGREKVKLNQLRDAKSGFLLHKKEIQFFFCLCYTLVYLKNKKKCVCVCVSVCYVCSVAFSDLNRVL